MTPTNKISNPVLIEVTRGARVESRHHGAVVAMTATGQARLAVGDVAAAVFPRSAIKPVQALPLIETGAADAFGVTVAELALACASHNGAADQVGRVRAWLKRLGLDETALACGGHDSLALSVTKSRAWAHEEPGPAHSNCSGKHVGFLTTALHMNESLAGYVDPDHPVQRRVFAAMAEMAEFDATTEGCGVDGCGIPACAMPLNALALAMAKMAGDADVPAPRAAAVARVFDAMTTHPDLIAGADRSDSALMAALRGRAATKIGAEGVHVAIVPPGVAGPEGLGVALKIDDGAGRAADVAMANVLDRLGVLDASARDKLAPWLVHPLINTRGERAGDVRPAEALSDG